MKETIEKLKARLSMVWMALTSKNVIVTTYEDGKYYVAYSYDSELDPFTGAEITFNEK